MTGLVYRNAQRSEVPAQDLVGGPLQDAAGRRQDSPDLRDCGGANGACLTRARARTRILRHVVNAYGYAYENNGSGILGIPG